MRAQGSQPTTEDVESNAETDDHDDGLRTIERTILHDQILPRDLRNERFLQFWRPACQNNPALANGVSLIGVG